MIRPILKVLGTDLTSREKISIIKKLLEIAKDPDRKMKFRYYAMADDVNHSFLWASTPEGQEYWKSIENKIQ